MDPHRGGHAAVGQPSSVVLWLLHAVQFSPNADCKRSASLPWLRWRPCVRLSPIKAVELWCKAGRIHRCCFRQIPPPASG